ncbi:putative callose synthase 6 [Panicum miliaceum]|uniref:Callose synthase 6 n=1 Tax=Panicum miliaceum TaxID=4540 RepID=A0A3L6TQN9_PANMI|nr:putative callose synthase 6 [Panicum miliaceum]
MNQFFRATIDGKDGDGTALRYYACNLLARTMPGGRPFCIMDFIWNEMRRAMCDPTKFLPSAPYIMYMIERVTKISFPKDCKHEPLHLHPHSGNAPPGAPRHAGATRNLRFDPPTSHVGACSSSYRDHSGSFIKRALKSIFGMCKSISQELNENHRDIIEIKIHLGLPYDPYHELHDVDDPFAEWDAADEAAIAAAHAPLPRPRLPSATRSRRSPPHGQEIFYEEEETEEEEPINYHEHTDSDEDEDTSEDDAQDDDDE